MDYVRAIVPGGTFFFTLVTHQRTPLFQGEVARQCLHEAIEWVRQRHPFRIEGMVLLPDHLHCMWTLPQDDHDFSTRWRKVKEHFTRTMRARGVAPRAVPSGKSSKGLRGFWQQRFWEHTIRDEEDFRRHADYIHYNPVKHGLVECPHGWAWSTFGAWVARNLYEEAWCCRCGGREVKTPDFATIRKFVAE